MSKKSGIYWEDELSPKFNKLIKQYEVDVHPRAMAMTGLQLINWVINGSRNESVVPPIKDGYLRGSGSVFVENRFVGGVSGYPTVKQNKEYNGKKNEITISFNTAYAARWHEEVFIPGPESVKSGDVGNKYLEKHLYADAVDLLALYADFYKKEMRKI